MKDYYYDKLFNIYTGDQNVNSDMKSLHYHPYEPTSYEALEHLSENYDVKEGDRFVDFGCGLGRFVFYTHYFYRLPVTGIEGNKVFYKKALENKSQYLKGKGRIIDELQFIHGLAEEYKIKMNDNCFYFFHPFSIQIFRKVIQNILVSVEEHKRVVDIILYYAHDDYIYFLENDTLFELVKELEIPMYYDRDTYERILIYRLEY